MSFGQTFSCLSWLLFLRWDAGTRGKALALFTLAPFAGPALGPLVGGYISTAGISWRWLFWILTLFAGLCTLFAIFSVPETYAWVFRKQASALRVVFTNSAFYRPIIMVSKAKAIRLRTGDSNYYAPKEREEKRSLWRRIEYTVGRPFKIMFQEPMLIAITIYTSVG